MGVLKKFEKLGLPNQYQNSKDSVFHKLIFSKNIYFKQKDKANTENGSEKANHKTKGE